MILVNSNKTDVSGVWHYKKHFILLCGDPYNTGHVSEPIADLSLPQLTVNPLHHRGPLSGLLKKNGFAYPRVVQLDQQFLPTIVP